MSEYDAGYEMALLDQEIEHHSTQRSAMGQHMSNLHTLGKLGIRSC